jgi:hypothetical protein
MRTQWLVTALLCSAVMVPAKLAAQEIDREKVKAEVKEDVKEAVKSIFGPHWKLFVHGGLSSQGRMVVQRSPIILPPNGERALNGDQSYNFGGGAAVDFLVHVGLRVSYTYSSMDLAFREDDGNGSRALDVDNVGRLRSHIAALEFVRYMFPHVVKVSPYASLGLVGSWWVLHQETEMVQPTGGSTQFRMGAIGSFGIRAKLNRRVDVRLEAASATVQNPFTGRSSFRAFGGTTIDEPTRIPRTDFRLALSYGFGDAMILHRK